MEGKTSREEKKGRGDTLMKLFSHPFPALSTISSRVKMRVSGTERWRGCVKNAGIRRERTVSFLREFE